MNQRHTLLILLLLITTLTASVTLAQQPPTPLDPHSVDRTVSDHLKVDHVIVAPEDITYADDWAFGLAVIPAPTDDHGEPWLVLFLARYSDGEWVTVLENDATFTDWLAMAPVGVFPAGAGTHLLAHRQAMGNARGNGSSLLSLPFASGQTWTLTGGPHDCCGSDTTNAGAIDLADGLTDGKIRAAREGVVWRAASCPNFIRIDHSDGWQTGYYHVINEQVSNGQAVARGQYIAAQGNGIGCGGSSTGPHLHFSLRYNGVPYSMHNHDIGGWTVLAGEAEYQGCMRRIRDGLLQCARGPIYNDGAIGSGDGTPLAPQNTDLMTNGDFSGGFVGWDTAFSTSTAVNGGILNWHGASGELPGTILQVVNYTAPVGSVVELQLDLGNTSNVQKRVRAHVQAFTDGEGVWDSGLLVCEFILPPNEDLSTYTLRRQIDTTWTQMRVWIEGYPGDGVPSLLTDNVQLRRVSNSTPNGTECEATPPPTPGPITRIAPADNTVITTFTDEITLQWAAREDTAWYRVQLLGPKDYAFSKWVDGTEVCADGVCTFTDMPLLNNGTYTWRMAGWNEHGVGAYNETAFIINVAAPGIIQRAAPTEFIRLTELTWQPDPLATWYHVYMARDGAKFIGQWYNAAEVCTAQTCRIEPPAIRNGAYTWWMAGWGPGGRGEYNNVPFTVDENPPATVQMLSPAGDVPAGNITLTWAVDPQAAWYRVYMVIPGADPYSRWYHHDDNCTDETCSVTLTLPPGNLTWWSVAWGPGGMGQWTSRTLTVSTP